MAVVQADIKADLLALYNDMKTTQYSETDFADAMATIIADAITSGVVTVTGVQTGGGTATGTIA